MERNLQHNTSGTRAVSRRDFLKAGAAIGALAALTACTRSPIPTPTPTPTPAPTTPPVFEALQFFNPGQAGIVHAAAGRIIPGTPDDPGAKEAGVVVFIDEALDGYDRALQWQYFTGLEGMEAYARSRYNKGFIELTEQEQDDILSNMDRNTDEAKQYISNPGAFFVTLRTHVRQGMFSDPIYGGNRDKVGWQLLGHPGIVFSRNTDEQKCDIDFPKEYMGVKEYYMMHPS